MIRIIYKNINKSLRWLKNNRRYSILHHYYSKSGVYLTQIENTKNVSKTAVFVRQFRTSIPLCDDSIIVKAPTFPESISSGDVKLLKKKGDFVKQDEVVLEVETDKTTGPITAPKSGIIEEFLVEHESTIKSEQPLFKLKVTADSQTASSPSSTPPSGAPPSAAPDSSSGSGETITLKAPTFPESIASGDVKLFKKSGDFVKQDEVVLEIETDKTTGPIVAPKSGVIVDLLVQDGSSIKSEQELFKIKVTASAPPGATVDTAPAPKAAPQPPPVAAAAAAPSSQKADPTKTIRGTRTEHPVKMSRLRLKVAERLKHSQNTYAMLTTFNEVDMSYIMQFRKANLKAFQKKHGIKLGLMSPFIKASAYALQDQPVVNSVIDGNKIIYRDYIDISIAMATPKGLAVPVLKNVQTMNYPEIEHAMAILGNKGRKNLLQPKDMEGGTFTISNGGVFGSLLSMPIINPPQSSILGMHGIFDRPVVNKGKIVVKPMMYICLTYDHRLIDGREAVLFLRTIKNAVEDPRSILAAL